MAEEADDFMAAQKERKEEEWEGEREDEKVRESEYSPQKCIQWSI